jgi:single-strand DNA-binding protein
MAGKSLNKVQLIGHLGKDPDLRYTSNGMAVATCSLATNEYGGKNDDGSTKDRTEWHRVVIFGKLAEVAGSYCKKGSQIYIEGRLQTRSWDDQQGVKHYTTEVVADSFGGSLILLGGRGEGGAQSTRPPHPADDYAPMGMRQGETAATAVAEPPLPPEMPEEEIPF